jgi:hypothetical protein
MSDLPTDVVIQYDSFTFPLETEIVGVQTTPVWDRAGRTVVALTHEWTIKSTIWVDPQQVAAGLDSTFDGIKKQLCRPGCNLVLENTAWGSYDVNPNGHGGKGPDSDLMWGPKPQLVSFRHLGYKYAAELTWKVSFCLDACRGAVPGKLLEWNYTLSFARDRSGYTRRTYAGYASIPMTRSAPDSGTLVDQADRLREQIRPQLPIGFEREEESYDLSEDKRTLTFRIVDQQLPPNIPPPGCIVAEASHTADNMIALSLVQWKHVIRASYELTTARARSDAFRHFQALVLDRQRESMKKGMGKPIMLHLHVAEPEIYGRKAAEFVIVYWQVPRGANAKNLRAKGNPAANIVVQGGLWRPVPQNSWEKWAASMTQDKAQTARGTANLVFNASDDAIVDLCIGRQPVPLAERALRAAQPAGVRVDPWEQDIPDPEDSFLGYKLVLEVQQRPNTAYLQPLPTSPVAYTPPRTDSTSQAGYTVPYKGGPCAITQYRGNPAVFVTLWGRALRAGYVITPPQLLSVGGQTPVPMDDPDGGFFRSEIIADLGIPIVAAEWSFTYLLPCPPRQAFGPPPNPLYGSVASLSAASTLSGFIA